MRMFVWLVNSERSIGLTKFRCLVFGSGFFFDSAKSLERMQKSLDSCHYRRLPQDPDVVAFMKIASTSALWKLFRTLSSCSAQSEGNCTKTCLDKWCLKAVWSSKFFLANDDNKIQKQSQHKTNIRTTGFWPKVPSGHGRLGGIFQQIFWLSTSFRWHVLA